ncbi:MAG: family 78 glycoside hydrolase catalytic domain, partial [Planctomycetes bacterium]|nr:family 78 glycoside hydrolase catalytic domain [Planctomycetota bacterium]
SVGYHELYVNGRKVGDGVLVPSVSDLSHRARYVTYDITELLKAGRNTIGIWLGVSWSIYPNYQTPDKPAAPLVIAQAVLQDADGATTRIATDESWKTHPSPNRLLGSWFFMNYGGELYDANQEVDGWCDVDFDDSAWQTAVSYSPKLILSAEMVEPNRRIQEIHPVRIEKQDGGRYRVDMGVNFAGMVAINVHGEPGTRIDFQFSEREDLPITHKLRSAYIIGPSGSGTFRNRFNYGVGRWITIGGLSSPPELADVRGWLVRSDFRRIADFECSVPLLNDIYRTTMWTFENLSLGGYVVDCPQRERMGYGGDGHASTPCGLNNYSLGAFYTKWAQDWRDVQGKGSAWGLGAEARQESTDAALDPEAGNLPYTAPTYWGGGGPAWSGFCITLPWKVYRQYDDTRILEENFPMMQRWLAFLETKSKNDMLVRWGGQWDFLGDWLWPGAEGVNGDTRETLMMNNCYWIYNLQTAAKIATILNNPDLAESYAARADEVRRAVHREFYKPDEASYVNGFQAYLAIALLVD